MTHLRSLLSSSGVGHWPPSACATGALTDVAAPAGLVSADPADVDGRRRGAVDPDAGRGVPALTARDVSLADLDEPALIAACLERVDGAFDVLVERHRRSVYRLCFRFVGNHEDAAELAQDVFVRAFRALDRFKGQSSIATWLYRIAVNVCLNRASLKRPVFEPLDPQAPIEERAESASDQLLRQERAVRVRKAIDQLPDKQRAALILRMYHELSHHEIAQTLGGTEGAAKANVFHALRRLRDLLGGEAL
jgi:RNA polymerase sigma-70 factor (ECF subfamily)